MIDDARWEKFVADPALKDWKVPLHKIRRMRSHVLSEREERLLALGAAALDGYDETFSQLTDVDMKFGVLIDDGWPRETAHSKLFQFVSGETRPRLAKARVPSILRGIPGSPVHACRVAQLFSESRRVSRTRKKLSLRSGSVPFQR